MDRADRITVIEDDNGSRTNVVYDSAGREWQRILPRLPGFQESERNYSQATYDNNNNPIRTDEYEYYKDETGTVHSQVLVTENVFDALDRQIETINDATGLAQRTVFAYDSLGYKVREIDPMEIGTRLLYDTVGRLVRTEIGYDQYFTQGQLDRTHNPDGLITKTLTYDESGNLLTEQDDAGNVTTYTYDNLGRRTLVTFADLTAERVDYRTDDLPEAFTALDELGQNIFEIHSFYNEGKQKTSEVITLPGGSPLSGVHQKNFAYDGLSRVLEAKAYSKDPSDPQRELLTITTRSYDSIDNVLSEIQRTDEDRGQGFTQIHSADLSMTFDGLKNRLTVASSLGGYSASYDFDALSRIERIGYWQPMSSASTWAPPAGS